MSVNERTHSNRFLGAVSDQHFQIMTGSRLHFGLLDTVAPFGGVGMMINYPTTIVEFRASDKFSASGQGGERAALVAQRYKDFHGDAWLPLCNIDVLSRPSPHSGLGTGTQLDISIAEGLCLLARRSIDYESLAVEIAGRGMRSAVGAHGYRQGGVIYEVGRKSDLESNTSLNAIRTRLEFPSDWHVVLIGPPEAQKPVSGETEQQHFRNLPAASSKEQLALTSIIEDELLPAIEIADFSGFSDAVYRYNRLSGALFADAQGGIYNGPKVTKIVEGLRSLGVEGVGQSSWGPTVFAFCEDWEMVRRVVEQATDWEILGIAKGLNLPRFVIPM